MVEWPEVGRQRPGEIVNDRSHALAHAVEGGVAFGQLRQRRLQLDAHDDATGHARGKAEADRADAGAEIEHALAGCCIDGGGQQHGIDGDTVTATRLQQPHAAAQQRVFGQGRFHATDHVTTSCRNNRPYPGDYPHSMATVVSLEGKRKAPSLEPLLSLCADDMTQVDREILARMRSPVALIPELANHLVGAGGKRMRPLLTVAAARLCGYAATTTATSSSRPASSSSIPPPCCTTTWSMSARSGAASRRPTRCGATRPRCWSATSCSRAPSS